MDTELTTAELIDDIDSGFKTLELNELHRRFEVLEAKAALLDRIHKSIYGGHDGDREHHMYIRMKEVGYGLDFNIPDLKDLPLMNVLRDVWKLYHPNDFNTANDLKGD